MSNSVAPMISSDRIQLQLDLSSKKRSLEQLSELLASAQPNLTTEEIFGCLIRRERLGSTGVGQGIALPHGRLQGLEEAIGAMIVLQAGVDYQANDEQRVDVMFAMLVPEDATEAHLQTLAALAEMFTDDDFVDAIRAAKEPQQACELLCGYATKPA